MTEQPIVESVPGYSGSRTWARWGEYGHPVPAVYVEDGVISVGEMGLPLDVAEAYAHRILAAVEHQRGELRRQQEAELARIAAGNGATHNWVARDDDRRCSRCRTIATVRCIQLGQVPTCDDARKNRCKLGWHVISYHLIPRVGLDHNNGDCMHCLTVYPTTAEEANCD